MKKAILGVVCIFAATCLLNAQDVNLPEGYQIIESSSPYTMVLTPYTTYPVLLQKYVPVNLFEGKWGSKPGEFGIGYTVSDEHRRPMSLAIDSQFNIYVLDKGNNRIQKFNPTGKYLKSIKLRSMAIKKNLSSAPIMNSDDSYYEGVNIEIDSKDHLYYYCYTGKVDHERAELWEFYNDVLVKKWKIPAGSFEIAPNDELMICTYDRKANREEQFNIRKQLFEERVENKIFLPWLDISFEGDREHLSQPAKLSFHNPVDHSVIEGYEYVPTTTFPAVWIAREAKVLSNGFLVYHHWKNTMDKIAFYDEFDTGGKLCSTILLPSEKIDFPRVKFDKKGNIYELVEMDHGMMVKKWTVKR